MPLSDSYWRLLYGSLGIDPESDDREDQLSLLKPITTPSYRGLASEDLDPYASEGYSFLGQLQGSARSAFGGAMSFTGDIFDRMSSFGLENSAWLADKLGNEDQKLYLQDQIQQLESGQGFGGSFAEMGRELQDASQVQMQTSGAQMESGGGIFSELAAGGLDIGESGAGLSPGEALGFFTQQTVNMGVAGVEGMATGGLSAASKAKALMHSISAGFAAQQMADTYANQREHGADASEALALGALDAASTYALERLGLESIFGRGVANAITSTGLSKSKVVNGALQGLVGLLGEGSTEAAQQLTSVLINELPDSGDVMLADWDVTRDRIQERLAAELPEAFAGGALFGGTLGGPAGFFSKPFAGSALRDQKAVQGPLEPQERIAERTADMVAKIQDANLDNDPDIITAADAAAEDAALASGLAQKSQFDAIKEQLEEEESLRAVTQEHVTEPVAEQIGQSLEQSIQIKVSEELGKVEQLQQMFVQLTKPQLMAGPEGEQIQMPASDPVEVNQAVSMAAESLGVQLVTTQDGSIDWQSTFQQVQAETERMASERIAPLAVAIKDSVDVVPGESVDRVASALPTQQPVAVTPAESAMNERQKLRTLLYTPDLRSDFFNEDPIDLGITESRMANPDLVNHANSAIRKRDSSEARFQALRQSKAGSQELLAAMDDLHQHNVDVRKVLSVMALSAKKKTLLNVGADVEALNSVTRSGLSYDPANSESAMGPLNVRGALLSNLASLRDAGSPRATGAIASFAHLDASETAALEKSGLARIAVHSAWQLGDSESKSVIRGAMLAPAQFSDQEVGKAVRNSVTGTVYESLFAEANDAELKSLIIGTGKGIMSPWAMERVAIESGLSPVEVEAQMAVVDAMAERWTKKNNKTVFEFYDRLGDRAELFTGSDQAALGTASSMRPDEVVIGDSIRSFSRGFIALSKQQQPSVTTLLHELTHLLEMSGLLQEMLEPGDLRSLEEYLGESLRTRSGLSAQAKEKLAMTFEHHLVTGRVPNKLKKSFATIREFLRDLLFKIVTTGELAYPAIPSRGINEIKWSDVSPSIEVQRAFLQLLNSNPDGSEIEYAVSAGAPGLARAVEAELAKNTALPANGVLTSYSGPARAPVTRDMDAAIGLTNPDANGSVFTEAKLFMQHELDLKREQDSTRLPAMSVRADLNKNLQEAVAVIAPLKDTELYDPLMDRMSDVLFTGGKDALYYGKKKDGSVGQFVAMLKQFGQAIQRSIDTGKQQGANAGIRSAATALQKTSYDSAKGIYRAIEKQWGNVGAGYEGLFKSLGVPAMSEWVNTLHSLGKLANGVVTELPKVMDPVTLEWQTIPGGKRFNDILADFTRFIAGRHASHSPDKPFKQVFEDMYRDLNIYITAQRQLEIADNAKKLTDAYELRLAAWTTGKEALGPGVAITPEPRKPRIPHVDPLATQIATNALFLMKARYGKDISMFERSALELVSWENKMVLYKLRYYNMITDKAYQDMLSSGQRYIPLAKLKEAIEEAGILDVRLDESMYDILRYLKSDTNQSIEAPLDQMLRKAKAIDMLTHRQLGRNVLGQKILENFDIWNQDAVGLTLLTVDEEVNEKTWNDSPLGNKKYTKVHRTKNPDGTTKLDTSGNPITRQSYHIPRSATAMEMEVAIGKLVDKVSSKGTLTADQARKQVERGVFTFYPKPGVPHYVIIPNPDLASSIFAMNNPQSVFAASLVEKLRPSEADSVGQPRNKMTLMTLRALHTGAFGWGNKVKRFITTTPQFLYNSVFRDLPNALSRTRHGLFLTDWAGGFKEALYYNLPSLRGLDPETHWLSIDAAKGTGNFVGLISGASQDLSDAHLLTWLSVGKSELMEKAAGGDTHAKRALLWKDLRSFAAREGLLQTPADLIRNIQAGEKRAKSVVMLGLSPITNAMVTLRMLGNVTENAWRMGERKLSMQEEITDPRLLKVYNTSPEALIEGKVRTGFTSTVHRLQWQQEKRKMASDPDYMPPSSLLPVQWNAAQRDYSMSHVTLNFSQKGSRTFTTESLNMFFNPSAQDTYTSLQKIANWSMTRKLLATWGGNKYQPLADQQLLDKQASTWLLSNIILGTIPALAMAAKYSGDDDESKRWQARSFIEKMSYWHIPMPEWVENISKPVSELGIPFVSEVAGGIAQGQPIRIASGLGFGTLLFKDLPMAAYLDFAGKDPNGMKKWGRRFLEVTSLGMAVDPIIRFSDEGLIPAMREAGSSFGGGSEAVNPVYELMNNYDEFRGRPIAWPTNEDPTETGRASYNALSSALAKALNIQPAQAAYLTKRYFPGMLSLVPASVNMSMEQTGMASEDVLTSSSPLASQGANVLPKVTARDPWGMSNEMVQDVLRFTRQSEAERASYFGMPEGRQPSYLSEHPLVQEDTYTLLANATYSARSGEEAAKEILSGMNPDYKSEQERRKAALDIRREYTLLALETMRSITGKITGGGDLQ